MAIAALACAACRFPDLSVIGDGSVDDATPGAGTTRLIAPLSGSTVTQQRPTLRWTLASGDTLPIVDLCEDRGCTRPLAIAVQLAADGTSAVPSTPLPPGWTFWRVRATSAMGPVVTATWQVWVGKQSASSAVDTSNGAILDVNGDGYADFVIGSHWCKDSTSGAGAAYVYLGSPAPGTTTWTGTAVNRLALAAPISGDPFAGMVNPVGDINGDGYGDFVVTSTAGELPFGPVHLYLGGPQPTAADWNATSTASRIDLDVNGVAVVGLGDFNGDGYADFAMTDGNTVNVYLGSAIPSATNWPRIAFSVGAGGVAGMAGGDLDGDGFADFVYGNSTGAMVYFGNSRPSSADRAIMLVNNDGPSAYARGISIVGDVTGDGYADLLIGNLNGNSIGTAHLYLGYAAPTADVWNASPSSARIDLVNPYGSIDDFAISLAGAGDIDGDGYLDFVIGADANTANEGLAYVYRGAAGAAGVIASLWNGTAPTHRLELDGPDGPGSEYGNTVAVVGDLNGDGYGDFVVATNTYGTNSAAHVYLGSSAPTAASWNGTGTASRIDLPVPDPGRCFGFLIY